MKIQIAQPLLIHELGGRENQEDAFYPQTGQASTDTCLFVVCDGMGGLEKGEVASQVVCQSFATTLSGKLQQGAFKPQFVQQAMDVAYQELCRRSNSFAGSMGTTLVMACLHKSGITLGHVGDSRGYLISPSRQLVFHTKDHSYVQQLCDMGQITEQQMRTHPKRSVLMQAIMPNMDEKPEVEITQVPQVLAGDYLMLCSDGIIERHTDDELLALFSNDRLTHEQKVEQLRQQTEGNADNHTAYIIPIQRGLPASSQRKLLGFLLLLILCIILLILIVYVFN